MKRKVLSVLLAMAVTVAYSVPCFAEEMESDNVFASEIETESYIDDNGDCVTEVTIPEEYFIVELDDMSDKELKESGYTKEDIGEIRELADNAVMLKAAAKDRSQQTYGNLTYKIKPTSLHIVVQKREQH